LYFLPKNVTMRGSNYINVLKEHLLAFWRIHQCDHVMHDGAPGHKSKIVTKFLNDNNINVLECPGNSPDLNPIENAWNYLKTKVQERKPSNINDLQEELKTLGNPGLHLLRLPSWFHAQKASNGHQFEGQDDKILIKYGIKDVNCKIFSFEFFVKIFSQCKDFFCRHCMFVITELSEFSSLHRYTKKRTKMHACTLCRLQITWAVHPQYVRPAVNPIQGDWLPGNKTRLHYNIEQSDCCMRAEEFQFASI